MVPIFSPRRRLYEALYEPEAIIPLFHYSNCERSELSSTPYSQPKFWLSTTPLMVVVPLPAGPDHLETNQPLSCGDFDNF